ncbi:hypothetical protein [Psychrobacter sp. FDAARGOS_221]|nr:hypothetical protein [Psychrobacter sp. FDAARGOS_221]
MGNMIGKRFLTGMSVTQFRTALLVLMSISGLVMIIDNIDLIL